jgi:putative tryptophan/tyrosine transport system substrate-binding protein
MFGMRRREFITLLGGAAAWPTGVRAQQTALPVLGLLSSVAFNTRRDQVAGFHRGLQEAGYVQGKNVAIEYRSANNQVDLLPRLAADLVTRQVAVIVTIGGDVVARAAKAATTTIPIIFVVGSDPVQLGLVASLNRPGGNATGISFQVFTTNAKRLELLSELVPTAAIIGFLVNPNNPNSEPAIADAQHAAQKLGKTVVVAKAAIESDLDTGFTNLVQNRVEALIVAPDPFFLARREQILALVGHYSLPTIYPFREFASLGGLITYGASLSEAYHEAGIYAGKILKGDRASDLPVKQLDKFELVINLFAAKALGLGVPLTLQVAADEVIE